MYSVEEFLEQADQASDVDDDLERVVEQNDLSGPHEDEAEEAKDDEGTSRKVAKKVRKPSNRPKLDVERLKGPRGLHTIEKMFTKVKIQGNGHEQEDLQTVMRTLHYWCHRLFPKYSFDDCLEHLERLGHKKPLITLKKKILYDLFEEDQPIVNDDEDVNTQDTQEAINEFDLLLQQEPIRTLSQPKTPERVQLTEEQKQMIERNRLVAAERRKARLEAQQKQQLTEQQKEIIERNRQQALEKLRAKNNLDISAGSSMVSEDATIISSQKSNQTANFNEIVDSFFPADDNDVDIDDLIEEINPVEETNATIVEEQMNVDETNATLVEGQMNVDETNATIVDEQMNVDETNTIVEDESSVLKNSETDISYDINSTKEDTTLIITD